VEHAKAGDFIFLPPGYKSNRSYRLRIERPVHLFGKADYHQESSTYIVRTSLSQSIIWDCNEEDGQGSISNLKLFKCGIEVKRGDLMVRESIFDRNVQPTLKIERARVKIFYCVVRLRENVLPFLNVFLVV